MGARVSIIIPCYNAAPWLAETLESALGQTWRDIEIIVVDDGSRDNSVEIAQRYAARGVQVHTQTNAGASAARNHGLRLARGEYIQFLDADDLLAPQKITAQMRRRAAEPTQAGSLLSGAWARFEGNPRGAQFERHANWKDLSGVEFLQLHYEQIIMMHPAAWLAPRGLLDQAGPWDESLSLNDDGEYFARVMLAAPRILFVPDARSYYRSNLSGSLSRRRDARALDSQFRSVELTVAHLLAHDTSERSRRAAAFAWKWMAFELYPESPELSDRAWGLCQALGGSRQRFPAGGRFQLASKLIGWRLAKRLFC